MDSDFTESEKRFVLAELMKSSNLNVGVMANLLKAHNIEPDWLAMQVPSGRSLGQCIFMIEGLLGQSLPPPNLKRKAPGSSHIDIAPKRPALSEPHSRLISVPRSIQPRPPPPPSRPSQLQSHPLQDSQQSPAGPSNISNPQTLSQQHYQQLQHGVGGPRAIMSAPLSSLSAPASLAPSPAPHGRPLPTSLSSRPPSPPLSLPPPPPPLPSQSAGPPSKKRGRPSKADKARKDALACFTPGRNGPTQIVAAAGRSGSNSGGSGGVPRGFSAAALLNPAPYSAGEYRSSRDNVASSGSAGLPPPIHNVPHKQQHYPHEPHQHQQQQQQHYHHQSHDHLPHSHKPSQQQQQQHQQHQQQQLASALRSRPPPLQPLPHPHPHPRHQPYQPHTPHHYLATTPDDQTLPPPPTPPHQHHQRQASYKGAPGGLRHNSAASIPTLPSGPVASSGALDQEHDTSEFPPSGGVRFSSQPRPPSPALPPVGSACVLERGGSGGAGGSRGSSVGGSAAGISAAGSIPGGGGSSGGPGPNYSPAQSTRQTLPSIAEAAPALRWAAPYGTSDGGLYGRRKGGGGGGVTGASAIPGAGSVGGGGSGSGGGGNGAAGGGVTNAGDSRPTSPFKREHRRGTKEGSFSSGGGGA